MVTIETPKTISETLRDVVRASGKSQMQIALAAGVSQQLISRFLSGKTVGSDTIDKLAIALGLHLSE